MAAHIFFVMLKPDAVDRCLIGTIISKFENAGFEISQMKMLTPARELVEQHYAEHAGKCFFEPLVEFATSGPVVAMVVSGNIDKARKLVGATVPYLAESGTIRGDFANSLPHNLVHCSDSEENGEREVKLWFG
jgi:nucleoside-diphosphate kinase